MERKHYLFRIKKSVDGQFYFTVCGKNNKVISTSETYKRRSGARRGIFSLFAAVSTASVNVMSNVIDET